MIPDGKSRPFSERLSALFNKLRKRGPNTAPIQIVFGESAARPVTVLKMPRPLDLAVRGNDMAEAKHLLNDGANPDLVTHFSGPALNEAAEYADTKMMALLLAHHANVNQPNTAGSTPLHRAIMAWDKAEEKTRFLLDNGADPFLKNVHGDTPLDIARHHKKDAIITMLEAAQKRRPVQTRTPKFTR